MYGNFNKYAEAEGLLAAMVEGAARTGVFRSVRHPDRQTEALVAILAKAGCFQMFVGVESFNRQTWPPRRDRTVRRCTATLYDCAAHTESARTFPTSLASRRTWSGKSTST